MYDHKDEEHKFPGVIKNLRYVPGLRERLAKDCQVSQMSLRDGITAVGVNVCNEGEGLILYQKATSLMNGTRY